MKNILVFDVGTSSMRGILYNQNGQQLFKKQIKYNPKYLGNNIVEQDPQDWINALIDIAGEISQKAFLNNVEIHAISIASQRSSIIPVDKNGNVLSNAIMWQDKRSHTICQELESTTTEVYNLTGSRVSTIHSAPKISWLKRNMPDIYSKAHKILTIHSYLLYFLTGRFVTDHSIASRSSLLNIRTLKWDNYLLNLFDIEESKLCELVEPGSICGNLTKTTSLCTKLKEGIPIITAGGDQQCALLGLNIINKGKIQVNTGTGSYIIASMDEPYFDKKMRVNCTTSAIPGKYIIEAGLPSTGTVYRWFNENFYQDVKDQVYDFQRIDADAQMAPIGANGLIMLPNFEGKCSSDFNPLAKGVFFNITLSTKRSDFARAILEGITAEISENINVIEELAGETAVIFASGGLTKSSHFNQIQADMYKKKVLCSENEEASSLGAWISSSKTLGLYSSYEAAFNKATEENHFELFEFNKENARIYDEFKKRKMALYEALASSNLYSCN